MKLWHDQDGKDFANSEVCFGRGYKTGTDKIDVAKISIRGDYPEAGWSYNESAHEMAVITRGNGWVQTKGDQKCELTTGDVVYLPPMERFRWGGDMDMIVPCGPAFDASKYHLEVSE